jgi:hypothetical protein
MKKKTYIVYDDVLHQGELHKWFLETGSIGEKKITVDHTDQYCSMFVQFLKLRVTHGLERVDNKIALTASNNTE